MGRPGRGPPSRATYRPARRTAASCARVAPRRRLPEADCAGRILGLWRYEAQRTADPLKGLDDFELLRIQIHIGSAQAQQLPAAHAEEQGQDVQGLQPMTPRSSEGCPGLFDCQATIDLVSVRWHLYQPGDVARDDLLACRGLQRVPEHCVDRLATRDRLWTWPATSRWTGCLPSAVLVTSSTWPPRMPCAASTALGCRRSAVRRLPQDQ